MEIERTGKPIRRPQHADFDMLMTRRSHAMLSSASYRNMLDNISQRDEVSAPGTCQWGSVVNVIRDRYGIPACIKVVYDTEDGQWGYDYISPEAIELYEPWSSYCLDDEYDEDYYDIEETDDE